MFDLSIKLKVDFFVDLRILLVVEGGSVWVDWSLKNMDFLSFITDGLVASWLLWWIFHLLDESHANWFLSVLLAPLLRISILLSLDSDFLIKELLWIKTGNEILIVLWNINIIFQELDMRSHRWSGIGLIGGVVSKVNLSSRIFLLGVSAGESPDSGGVIL